VNINKYIQELLVTHSSVVLPGVGLIQASHKSAEMDSNNNLLAPGLHITFDPTVTEGQDRLIKYIAQQSESKVEDVKIQYDEYLKNLWEKINNKETVELGDLGVFKYDATHKIAFELNSQGLFYNTLLGLKPIQAVPLVPADSKTKNKKTEKMVKTTTQPKMASDKQPKTEPKYDRKKILTYALSALVILALFAIPVKYFLIDGGKWNTLFTSTNKTIKQDSLDKLAKLDSLGEVDEEKPDYTANTGSESSNTTANNVANKVNNEPTKTTGEEKHIQLSANGDNLNLNEIPRNSQLHLVAGSFRNKTNAEKLQRSLLNEGYNSEIIMGKNGLRRVTLGSFSDVNTALAIYKQYQTKSPETSVWLLVIK